MFKVTKAIYVLLIAGALFIMGACQGGGSTATPVRTTPSVSGLPAEQFFSATGVGATFQDARQDAYKKLLTEAAKVILGNQFEANRPTLEQNYLSYVRGRQFIMGEQSSVEPDKQRKLSTLGQDGQGNTQIRLEAWVYMHNFRDAIERLGISASPATTTTTTTTTSPTTTTPVTTTTSSASEDLSGVDLSGMEMLVFYKSQGLSSMDEQYSKVAVTALNRELSQQLGISIKDLETMERLASERALLQEEAEGTVGMGLLLANQVAAELYAEVWTTIGYSGTSGQAVLNVKIYARTTGDVIADLNIGGRQMDGRSRDASLRASIFDATDKIIKQITPALKRYADGGRVYFVRLTGVQNYADASRFSRAMNGIKGTVDVNLRSHSRNDMTSDYSVRFKGNPMALLDGVFDTLPSQPGFENLDLQNMRGNEIIFRLH
jgi:hypothetical protein